MSRIEVVHYLAGKSAVLQDVLEISGEFSDAELQAIRRRSGHPGHDGVAKR